MIPSPIETSKGMVTRLIRITRDLAVFNILLSAA